MTPLSTDGKVDPKNNNRVILNASQQLNTIKE